MSDDEPTVIRFRPPAPSHGGIHAALERLAMAIASAEIDDTDEVEGFKFDTTGSISLTGPKVGGPQVGEFCIGFHIVIDDDGKMAGSSCWVEWL